MDDRGQGYPTSLIYHHTLLPQTSPGMLSLIALSQQRLPPRLDRPFRYADLGCGSGLSLLSHAAISPQSTFHGFDYLPDHVALARRMADDAGLNNVSFSEVDFATLAQQAPPTEPYDFIVVHGVWSWVSMENRMHLLQLAERWLAPGGLLYVSYNARPYWNALDPLRRVLRELLTDAAPGDLSSVRQTVSLWLDEQDNATMREYWEEVSRQSDRYLIHDFASRHADASWPMDVSDALTARGLTFLGEAPMGRNFPVLAHDDAAAEALNKGRERGYGRVATDLASPVAFRMDVFGRGAPKAGAGSIAEAISDWRIYPHSRPSGIEPQRALLSPTAEAQLDKLVLPSRLYDALTALDMAPRKALQLLLLALATERLEILPPPAHGADDGARRFNGMVAALARQGEPLSAAICAKSGRAVPIAPADAAHLWGGQTEPDWAEWLDQFDFSTA